MGIGTNAPSKKLDASSGSQSFTVDPAPSGNVVLNTTGSANMTVTSNGGSVIVRLA